jgi:CheY-like chemotaxis protein
MNLAVNARDAMPAGGALVVSTAIVHARPPRSAAAAPGPGQYARLTVRDSGTGIAPEHLPHIFEPFYTTKDKARSTGLGLATVFGIVEQHRGWVEVHTRVGEGTTFDVYVPQCAHGTVTATPIAAAPAPMPRGHECVLVVEDELPVREMVRDVLVRQGYRVHEAGSGREALDVWSRFRADIDLVLTDIVMPDGIMGTDLVRRLMADRPGLPVIFTSGYSQESDRVSVDLVDGVNFLQKPYRPATLIRLMRDRLEKRV